MIRFASTFVALAAGFIAGCATAPPSEEGRAQLSSNVQQTMARLKNEDPSFENFMNKAYAYAIFPSVGKGGLGVGGAYGRGEVYEQGKLIGYADISQATIGLQAGGQTFTEVIAFEDKLALDRFTRGQLKFEAAASAVALKSGAAAAARYTDGVAVFVEPRAGLMVEASIGGQSFSFQPI